MVIRVNITAPVISQDLTGHRFGRLTVLRHVGFWGPDRKHHAWLCRCECGNELRVRFDRLKRGTTTSCGCYRREFARDKFTSTDGPGYHILYPVEYSCHQQMMNRCYNQKCQGYKWYGARGIKVCERWRYGEDGKTAFECFLDDMGLRVDPSLSIDRIDNDGNYEPMNCRWATKIQQSRNRRRRPPN